MCENDYLLASQFILFERFKINRRQNIIVFYCDYYYSKNRKKKSGLPIVGVSLRRFYYGPLAKFQSTRDGLINL